MLQVTDNLNSKTNLVEKRKSQKLNSIRSLGSLIIGKILKANSDHMVRPITSMVGINNWTPVSQAGKLDIDWDTGPYNYYDEVVTMWNHGHIFFYGHAESIPHRLL